MYTCKGISQLRVLLLYNCLLSFYLRSMKDVVLFSILQVGKYQSTHSVFNDNKLIVDTRQEYPNDI